MFLVSNYILQTCNNILKFQSNNCDICTHSLENVPKQLRKTVIIYILINDIEKDTLKKIFIEFTIVFKVSCCNQLILATL